MASVGPSSTLWTHTMAPSGSMMCGLMYPINTPRRLKAEFG